MFFSLQFCLLPHTWQQPKKDNCHIWDCSASAKVENHPYCAKVLEARMIEGALPRAPIIGDVRGYTPDGDAASATAISMGFPCQVGALTLVRHVMSCLPGVTRDPIH